MNKPAKKIKLVRDVENDSLAVSPFPELHERPCFKTYWQAVEHEGKPYKAGLYYHGVSSKRDGADPEPEDTYVCGAIEVLADTQDEKRKNWGRLVRIMDKRGSIKELIIPMDVVLSDRSLRLISLLGNNGLDIHNAARGKLISTFINNGYCKENKTTVNKTGWYKANKSDVFVFPDEVIGDSDLVFYSEEVNTDYSVGGTLEGWQENIGRYAIGNPIIQLAIMAGLAGALLRDTGIAGGGLHLYGESSKGKTTALLVGASVWGDGASYIRTWNATSSGLEGTAKIHNDTLLCLDELKDTDAKEVDKASYNLANGKGRTRSQQSGDAKKVAEWRIFALSNGELSVRDFLASAGIRLMAGQTVRLLDMPATGQRYGAFDVLHGFQEPKELAQHLGLTSSEHYGHIGKTFIKWLIETKPEIRQLFKSMEKHLCANKGLSNEEERGAKLLALCALAGELAIEAELLPWEKEDPIKTAEYALSLWVKQRGLKGFNHEAIHILKSIKSFIDVQAMARMLNNAKGEDEYRTIPNQAGWYIANGGKIDYMFNRDGLIDAAKTHNVNLITDTLKSIGAISEGDDGRSTKLMRVKGLPNSTRVYIINIEPIEKILEQAEPKGN